MNNKDLIDAVAQQTGYPKTQAETALKAAFGAIAAAVGRGDDVVVHGFGAFKRVQVQQRQGRNLQTGEAITIAAHHAVKFRPSPALKSSVA